MNSTLSSFNSTTYFRWIYYNVMPCHVVVDMFVSGRFDCVILCICRCHDVVYTCTMSHQGFFLLFSNTKVLSVYTSIEEEWNQSPHWKPPTTQSTAPRARHVYRRPWLDGMASWDRSRTTTTTDDVWGPILVRDDARFSSFACLSCWGRKGKYLWMDPYGLDNKGVGSDSLTVVLFLPSWGSIGPVSLIPTRGGRCTE